MAFETPWFLKSKTFECGRANQSFEEKLQRSKTELELKQRHSLKKIDLQMRHVREEFRQLRADVDFSTDLDENGNQIDLEACRSKSTGDVPGKPKDTKLFVNFKGSRSANGWRKARAPNEKIVESDKTSKSHSQIVPFFPKITEKSKAIVYQSSRLDTMIEEYNSKSEQSKEKKQAKVNKTKHTKKEKTRKKKKHVEIMEPPGTTDTIDYDRKELDTETQLVVNITVPNINEFDTEVIRVVNKANKALLLTNDDTEKSLKRTKKNGLERSITFAGV